MLKPHDDTTISRSYVDQQTAATLAGFLCFALDLEPYAAAELAAEYLADLRRESRDTRHTWIADITNRTATTLERTITHGAASLWELAASWRRRMRADHDWSTRRAARFDRRDPKPDEVASEPAERRIDPPDSSPALNGWAAVDADMRDWLIGELRHQAARLARRGRESRRDDERDGWHEQATTYAAAAARLEQPDPARES